MVSHDNGELCLACALEHEVEGVNSCKTCHEPTLNFRYCDPCEENDASYVDD